MSLECLSKKIDKIICGYPLFSPSKGYKANSLIHTNLVLYIKLVFDKSFQKLASRKSFLRWPVSFGGSPSGTFHSESIIRLCTMQCLHGIFGHCCTGRVCLGMCNKGTSVKPKAMHWLMSRSSWKAQELHIYCSLVENKYKCVFLLRQRPAIAALTGFT